MTKSQQDLKIVEEFEKLVFVDGKTRIEARKYLCKKYNIRSHRTIYNIISRVNLLRTQQIKAANLV